MGESPRAAFSMPASLKKDRKARQSAPTHRFTLDLHESNDKTCPEFSFRDLSATKRVKKETVEPVPPSGADPFGEEHDQEKVKELARKFEEKYGSTSGKRSRKKAGRLEDYIDLGMGYDETDPFIDNTDAYDELVPSTLTTQYGGFYINSGRLDFREVNSDSSDDNSTDDTEIKRKRRRILDKDMKRKRKHSRDGELNPRKRGRKPAESEDGALNRQRKKQPTVATLLLQYKAQQQQTQGGGSSVNGTSSAANGSDTFPDASNDSESPVPMDDTDGIHKLPERLPDELEETIKQLKVAALKSAEGKCKFFSAEVNNMLLNIELMSRELSCSERSMIYANLASHLPCTKETLLKRAKKLRVEQEDTKLKDAVKRLRDAVMHAMPVMELKFKAACQSFDSKAALVASKKDNSEDDEDGTSGTEDVKSGRIPRRKFEWNEDLRKILCEVVTIKMRCYEVAKLRSPTAEDYLKQYLEIEIRCIWPKGWMHVKRLIKESRAAHSHLTSKPKKVLLPTQPRKLSAPGPIQGTVTSVKAVSLLTGQYTNSPIISDSQMATAKIVPSASFTPIIQPVKSSDDTPKTITTTITPVASPPCSTTLSITSDPHPSSSLAKSEPSVVVISVTTTTVATPAPVVSIVSSAPSTTASSTATSTTTTDVISRTKPRMFTYSDQASSSQYSSATDVLGEIINATLADFPNSGTTKYPSSAKYRDSELFSTIVTKFSQQQSSLTPTIVATKSSSSDRERERERSVLKGTSGCTSAVTSSNKVVTSAHSKSPLGSDLTPSRQHSALPRVAPTQTSSRRVNPTAVTNPSQPQSKKTSMSASPINMYMSESKRQNSAKQTLAAPYHSMYNMQEAIERSLQAPNIMLGHAAHVATTVACPSNVQSKSKNTNQSFMTSYPTAKEGGNSEQPLNFSKSHRHTNLPPGSLSISSPKASSSPVPEVSISIVGHSPDRSMTNRHPTPEVLEGLARSFVEQHAKAMKHNSDSIVFSRSGGCDMPGTTHRSPLTTQTRTNVSSPLSTSGKSLLSNQQMSPGDPHRNATSQAKSSGWPTSTTMPATSSTASIHYPNKMHSAIPTNKSATRNATHPTITLPMDSSSRNSLISPHLMNAVNARAFGQNPAGLFDPSTYVNAALQQVAVSNSNETRGQIGQSTSLGLPRSISNVADKLFTPPS